LLLAVIIMTALTWLCVRAAAALRDARRWGAYVAMAFGLLLLLFSASFIYDMYHPERQGPDDYFGILFVPFTLLIGLWWCISLNLPHVRAYLKWQSTSAERAQTAALASLALENLLVPPFLISRKVPFT
jgi:hypothetical protein